MKQIFLLTFNCNKRPINESEFGDLIKDAFDGQEIAVFAFQEVCPIVDACLDSQQPYVDILQQTIEEALGQSYVRVDTVIVGAVALLVYISGSEASHKVATARGGMFLSSLKGAAGIRMQLPGHLEYTFVAAHLAAGEGQAVVRNQNFHDLVTRLDFGDKFGAYKPGSQLFFLGDLNYRATSDPFAPTDDIDLDSNNLLEPSDEYMPKDELVREMQRGDTFHGLTEAEVDFKPTYKFIVGSSEIYNSKRIPSWCDRILYQSYHGAEDPKIHKYQPLAVSTSDHKPVYLSITVPDKPVNVIGNDGYLLDDSRRVYLGLDSKSGMYAMYGKTSDALIGWSMFLTTTKLGNLYLGIGLAALWGMYLFVF